MPLLAQLTRDDRAASREPLDVDGTLRQIRNRPLDVVVEDLSATGFRIRTQAGLSLQERVTIGIPGLGQRHAFVVRHASGGFGCKFIDVIDEKLVTVPSTVQSVVEINFGRQLDVALIREWSRNNAPYVERFPQIRRLFIVGGLGVTSWLIVFGVISLFRIG